MVRNPISAENFTQLFSSLETLDVMHIVSTLLKIAPLRDEIRRQMKSSQSRVRRRRRTRAEMETLTKYGSQTKSDTKSEQLISLSSTIPPSSDKISSQSSDIQCMKKKSRKGTPAKLNGENSPDTHQPQANTSVEVQTPAVNVSPQTDTPLSTALLSSTSNLSSETAMTTSMANFFPNNSDLSKGIGMFNPLTLHSLPYWNMLQMTANRLMYNYNHVMVPPFNGRPKSANDVTDYLTPTNPQSPQPTDQSNGPDTAEKILDAEEDEEEETIDVISDQADKLSENQIPELTSTNIQAPNSDCSEDACSEEIISKEPTINNETNIAQNSTEINCPDCGTSVILASLTDHIQNQCSKGLSDSLQELNATKMGKIVSSWESCTICFESVPGKKGMMKHIRQRHSIKKHPFVCEICSERFRNKSTLKRHQITHTSGGGHSCTYCAKIFAKPELLRRHELLHTEIKRTLWPCAKCNKSFSNKYNLAVHDRMHTGELPFPCPECPEKFRVKCSMQNHIKSRHPNAFIRCTSPSLESESSGLWS